VLRELDDELNAAVLEAYGWQELQIPRDNAVLLERLVNLNSARAADELLGNVRWLRPALQAPAQGQQAGIAVTHPAASGGAGKPLPPKLVASAQPWPSTMAQQVAAVAAVLENAGGALDLDGVAAHFKSRGRWRERLPAILDGCISKLKGCGSMLLDACGRRPRRLVAPAVGFPSICHF